MALLKIQRFFGAAPNELLNNPDISFKAKGLYAYLNSKPDNWDFSVESIAAQVKEGIDSVRGGIHELEKSGYLKRIKYQNEKGYWEIDYMLFESPVQDEAYLGKSNEGEHPKQYKKEDTKKEYTNNNTGGDLNSSHINKVTDNPDEMKKGGGGAAGFVKPSIDEIHAYAKVKHEMTDMAAKQFAEEFWNFYESKGWLVGKSKMKSWQSAVSGTWKEKAIKLKGGSGIISSTTSNVKFNIK